MATINVFGMVMRPVIAAARHPELDVAFGMVDASVATEVPIVPMTLATTTLNIGAEVAVFGYPRSITDHRIGQDGGIESGLAMTPDYYEGIVEEHHLNGLSLVSGPAYLTNIVPPSGMSDLGGASGGPLVCSQTLYVHGLLSSSGSGYSICTDIVSALDWDLLLTSEGDTETIRQMAERTGMISLV